MVALRRTTLGIGLLFMLLVTAAIVFLGIHRQLPGTPWAANTPHVAHPAAHPKAAKAHRKRHVRPQRLHR